MLFVGSLVFDVNRSCIHLYLLFRNPLNGPNRMGLSKYYLQGFQFIFSWVVHD